MIWQILMRSIKSQKFRFYVYTSIMPCDAQFNKRIIYKFKKNIYIFLDNIIKFNNK